MTWTNKLAAGACAVVLTGGAASGLAQMGELVDRDTLRVCADPNHLPFSNEAGEGFENKIAELLAEDLGVDLAYTWHPQVVGFVRNTLGARACDLVMGIVTTSEVMQNTNPYYRSSYVLVQRADAGTKVTSLDDPKLADLRIGAVAQTPPVDLLARGGLLKNVRPYHLMVDTRYDDPGRQMVEDVAAGEIDVGVLWGPIAGYWAKQQSVPMEVVPLTGESAGARLDFRITMGLRRNEPEWKGILNEFLAEHKPEIQDILLDYGVPLLDERGRPIEAAAATQHGALDSVPEPDGFRLADYRAPVPATLRGATTVSTTELQALLAAEAPVLIDVLPAARPPADRAGSRIWRDASRANLPGSVWLPNVGYGELAPEFATWFEDNLARLSAGDRARRLVFYCQAECWIHGTPPSARWRSATATSCGIPKARTAGRRRGCPWRRRSRSRCRRLSRSRRSRSGRGPRLAADGTPTKRRGGGNDLADPDHRRDRLRLRDQRSLPGRTLSRHAERAPAG